MQNKEILAKIATLSVARATFVARLPQPPRVRLLTNKKSRTPKGATCL